VAAPASSPIRRADTDEEILACFPLFAELRPHLVREEIVARVRRQQREHGYELVYIADADGPAALAGFRLAEFLAWGRVLYVDDLVTAAARQNRGHGGRLLDWLLATGRERRCDELHLDSGVLRHAAHRLYHSRRLEISSHHFSVKLG